MMSQFWHDSQIPSAVAFTLQQQKQKQQQQQQNTNYTKAGP
jgi:hypothetical protein